jgi:hypothetical protein
MPRVTPDNSDIVVWKFDDSGAPFVNSSTSPSSAGSAANLTTLSSATVNGVTTPKLQQVGPFAGSKCVEFFGSQSASPRAFISGANAFRPQPPITISGWILLFRYDASFTQHWFQKQHTIGIWSGSTFQTVFFQNRIYVGQSEQVDIGVFTGPQGGENTGVVIDISRRIPLGIWCHVGQTFDGNNSVFYLNGDVWATSTLTGSPRTINYDTSGSSGPWFIGAIPSGSGAPEEPYCKLADWRVANVVRPKSYFENIYYQGQLSWTGNVAGL